MSDYHKRITALSPEQRELLEWRLKQEGVDSASIQIPRQPPERAAFPLSFAQQRLWFLDQLMPGNPAYHIAAAWRLHGPLDQEALERSFRAIVERHATLRTRIVSQDGQPQQLIIPAEQAAFALERHDLRHLPALARADAAERLAQAGAQQPFDLAAGPLLRAGLACLDPREHMLYVVLHHLISDGWSITIFIRELATLYNFYASAQSVALSAPLPDLPIQYGDFAVWQREWLAGPILETQLAYWTQQLRDLPTLELPTDRPHPLVQSFRGGRAEALFPAAPAEGLRALCLRERVTTFMLLLAAFDVLLARYSGQDDIAIGTPIAGRTHPEVEGLIGCFVNALVLRADLSGNPTFRELLQRVREVVLGAYQHQDLPFEMLVDELQPARNLSHNPLFQVVFSLQNISQPAPDLPGLNVSPALAETNASQFDLTLSMADAPQGLGCVVRYNADLFDAATITRMLGHLQILLEGIAANPDCRISALPLLTPQERRAVVEWNATEVAYPTDACLHDLVAAQAARTPDAVALAFDHQEPRTKNQEPRTKNQEPRTKNQEPRTDGDATRNTQHATRNTQQFSQFSILNSQFSSMTYGELDRRANQLAHHLQSLGMGPETLVALYLDRSLDLVVAILAVLKAGGAYLPLDLVYPPERLAFMLEDAQAKVLLTTKEVGDWRLEIGQRQSPISNLQSPTTVYLDTDWEAIAQQPATNPESAATPDSLAYVIYTSGSTGKPKGVQVTHANVVRLFTATEEWYHFDDRDVWTLFHSYAFDFSVWELWGALLYGGRLVVVPYLVSRSPDAFYELLANEQVTVLNQTPSAFGQLIRAEQAALRTRELALRYVIFGGEALELASLRPWFERHGDAHPRLVNMYGITETTVHVTYRPITLQDLSTAPGSVIGGPIPDLLLYVLDAQMQPVPIGVPGELYVGGAGVARGYLNRPELTAKRFVPNPFAQEGLEIGDWRLSSVQSPISNLQSPISNRLYKTGDLARYLPDGDLEYLGRIDQQVKIRGFRIELGEIEAALRRHPQVRETVVLAREDVPGEKRLVAYVVPSQEPRTKNQEPEDPTEGSQFSVLDSADGSRFSVLGSAELRQFLRARLPDYMLPAAFVLLDALPLSPNGKLDRRALPAPDDSRPALAQEFVAPSTPEEQILAEIWARALGIKQVGVHDNFFDLGGDSMRSMQVLAQAREHGLRCTLQQLFQHQTIAELAGVLETSESLPEPVEPIQPFSLLSAQDRAKLLVAGTYHLEDAYPLTKLQAGMLFHSEYAPDSAAYHDIFSYHLQAPLDAPALRAALQQLAARHPMLRTAFDLSGASELLQLVHRSAEIPLQLDDLRHLIPAEQEDAITEWIEAEKRARFDWTRPPLLRFQIHRRSEETFQLTLSFHHAILDGWSVAAMLTELFQRYLALLGKVEPPRDSRPTDVFRDFVALERAALASEDCRSFWVQDLGDSTATLLPRRPVGSLDLIHQVGRQAMPLAPETSEGLRALARSAKVPLKTVLLAAHLRVLRLLGGQSDVVTGMLAHGRPEQTGSERSLGLFLNSLPFRLNLAGGTWRDLVRETFRHEQELVPFQRYPMAEIQRVVGRQPLFETIFTFVNFHVYEELSQFEELRLLGARVFEETQAILDANFTLDRATSQVRLSLTFDRAQFGREQISAIGRYYANTLAAMAGAPDDRYETCDLLAPQERRQMVEEWNATEAAYATDVCLHDLVAAQAARTPNAVALIFDHRPPTADHRPPTTDHRPPEPRTKNQEPEGTSAGGSRFLVLGSRDGSQFSILNSQFSSMTYRELNERANQLAHELRARGVGPEALVGVCLHRSLDLVVALLATLKAGGAYLPLDPDYPAERLRYMLEDAQASVLLTSREIGDWRLEIAQGVQSPISNLQSPSLVYLDTDWEQMSQQPATDPESGVSADNLAYVIYTSGSTGAPKGAMNSHRAIVNRLLWMQERYRLGADDRVMQKTPFSFDVSVWEFFWPLLCGATLVLARPGGHQDPAYLAQLIQVQHVTTLHFVPSMLRVFLEAPGVERCGIPTLPSVRIPQGGAGLRRVICSGEELTLALVERFFARLGATGVELHNLYGPTEAAVDVSAWECRPAEPTERVPIGHPVANTQLYILDPQLQPVPIGVAGELYIGGVQLARGYLNRPELTAERFIPNPFAARGGEGERGREGELENSPSPPLLFSPSPPLPFGGRLYKTGDLCRYREDGAIEYLGRRDFQVKLRGFRIELGEIEAALRQHPQVREAVVALREDVVGDRRLVAYIVAGDWRLEIGDSGGVNLQSPISNLHQELRGFLKNHLPDYMIPAAFVLLDALPLNPNGKLDRHALPPPDPAPAMPAPGYVAPRTPVEEQVAQIWAEILKAERVGIHDNFFDLGGHSLLAVEITFKLRDIYQIDLPLQVVFDMRTVANLATAIVQMRAEQTDSELIDHMLAELENLSEEEVQRLLAGEEATYE